MSLAKKLARVLFLATLAISVLGGARMSQHEIEELMNAMHRTAIVLPHKKDRPV